METKKIINIAIQNIITSDLNPRKTFNQKELEELAQSLKEIGMIQPITVREKEEKFQIVCGERRYRASKIAQLEQIPAIVTQLNDEEARNYAIVENGQREDVKPSEEADYFDLLIKEGKETISSLACKIAKSETYIRQRLILINLVDDLKSMLDQDKINFQIAMLLASYDQEIQQRIAENNLADDPSNWSDWSDLNYKAFKEKVEYHYNFKLDQAKFDTTVCQNCKHNSLVSMLFSDNLEGAQCKFRECFETKRKAHNEQIITEVIKENKDLPIASYYLNDEIKEFLEEQGHNVAQKYVRYTESDFKEPVKPNKKDYIVEGKLNKEEYQISIEDYKEELQNVKQKKEKVEELLQQGKLQKCVSIDAKGAQIGYIESSEKLQKEDSPKVKILELESKIARNEEIKIEKTIADIKEQVINYDTLLTKEEIGEQEEKMFYFYLMEYMTQEQGKVFVEEKEEKAYYYLEEKDKLEKLKTLTQEDKNLLMRCFIMDKVRRACNAKSIDTNNLITFSKMHFEKETKEIEKQHQEVYSKRNNRLQERIDEIK